MKNKFLLYQTAGGKVAVDVLIKDETVWLTKRQMAELFGVDRSGISRHIKNILQAGELEEAAVCANFAHTIPHGVFDEKTQTKEMEFYNLDMIISVGYRVNSARGAEIWRMRGGANKRYNLLAENCRAFIKRGSYYVQAN